MSFDSLLQDIRKLPPQLQVTSLLHISYKKEEEINAINRQEKLLLEALSMASSKEKKEILMQLICLYSQLDNQHNIYAYNQGMKRIDELESNYSLSQEDQWEISKQKALLLNGRGQQEQYLPLWYKLLSEHRTANRPSLIVADLYAIANHFQMLDDQEKALTLCKEGYKIATDNKLIESQSKFFISIVSLSFELKRYSDVIKYYHEIGIDSAISLVPLGHYKLATSYLHLQKPDSARIYLFQKESSKPSLTTYSLITETYIAEENVDSASFFLDKAIARFEMHNETFKKNHIKASLPPIFLHITSLYAELLQRKGKTEQAQKAFSLIEPLMHEVRHEPPLIKNQIEALTKYSNYCRTTHQYIKALDLLARRDSLQTIYDTYNKERDSKNLIARFQSLELEHQVEMQKMEVRYSSRIIIITLSLCSILVCILTFIVILYWQRKKQRSIIFDQNLEIQQLKSEMPQDKELPAPEELLYRMAEKTVKTESLYRNNELTIKQLAKTIHTNRSYLSKSINTYGRCNFSQWINNFRVEYILEQIPTRDDLDKLVNEAGFDSTDTFYRNFRRYTGLPPAKYIKQNMNSFNKDRL